jgi:hypothetical protein
MYMPPTFLTVEVLKDVVSKFEWPAPYTFEDKLPDGIILGFPKCHLFFSEGFESDMSISFLKSETGRPRLMLPDAIRALEFAGTKVDTPDYGPSDGFASLQKVRTELHELCTLALAYLKPCILGDFSWVAAYDQMRAAEQQG